MILWSNKSNWISCFYSISLFHNGLKPLKDRKDLGRRWMEGRGEDCEQNPAAWCLLRPGPNCDLARLLAGAPMILICNQNWEPAGKSIRYVWGAVGKNAGSTREVISWKALRPTYLGLALERKGNLGDFRTRSCETKHSSPTAETGW